MTAAGKIRLGVIGLGRLWEARHKPALARLQDRFEVTAVYDQVARRAEIEARQLGCRALDGLSELVHSPDVDAVLWLAPQWFAAYPVELAARAGKPIYGGVPLPEDLGELDRLDALIRTSAVAFMPEFAPRFYLATIRLRQIIDTTRGQIIRVQGVLDPSTFAATPANPTARGTAGSISSETTQALVDWSRYVTGTEVMSVAAGPVADQDDPPASSFDSDASLTSEASFSARPVPPEGDIEPSRPRPVIEVTDGRRTAWLEWPNLIRWSDGTDVHEEQLTDKLLIGEVLLDQFYRLVRGSDHSAPTWDDALAAARAVVALRASVSRGGGRVHLEFRPPRVDSAASGDR